jgi:hypothetical protein
MAFRVATAALAALMTTAAMPSFAVAQSETGTVSSEQIETGRVRMPGGTEIVYRIRMLPLASFPALPAEVAAQLEQRKCMIPQTYEARSPENVVHASLERKGSSDWAVLCSVNGATTLYVFFQSLPGAPVALRHQRNTEWLGSEVLGAYGSAWGIARRTPSQMRQARGFGPGRVEVEHDGIEDAFIERSSTTHYFQDGSWITLENSN